MQYENIVQGVFLERPNRFVAICLVQGEKVRTHVKNTGRCRELLVPGTRVYLEDFAGRMGARKLRYSLISVEKGSAASGGPSRLINMDSQAPNQVVAEALESGVIRLPGMGVPDAVKREQTFDHSRFDFYVRDEQGTEGYVEVKGVTLEEDGIARFPDAPTQRGVRHIEELMLACRQGYRGYLIFVVQMRGVHYMEPNDVTHKAFGDALRRAQRIGVRILAYDCYVRPDLLSVRDPVRVVL